MPPPRSPVPQEVSAELRRVVERWQQLPLTTAEARMPRVRLLLDHLAAATAPTAGPVPDLGPAVLMDQLAVLVHDACAAAPPGSEDVGQDVAARLTALRKTL